MCPAIEPSLSDEVCFLQFRKHASAESRATFFERALNGLSKKRSKSPSTTEQPQPSDQVKGPLGLNLLHSPSEPLIEFIFVHGLGGGSRKTWSKTADPHHYWPKEWLPKDPDFRNARIYSFGYAADWGEKKARVLEINDFARSLLGEIKDNPDIRRDEVRMCSLHICKPLLKSTRRHVSSWLPTAWAG